MASITAIKDWFKKGLKPTQAQFYALFDSYRHKDDKVPINDVDGLALILSNVPSTTQLNAGVQDAKDYAELVGLKRFTAVSPILTSTGVICVWTIPNSLSDEYAHAKLYNSENDVVNIQPNITASSIVYTFASTVDFPAGAYRVSVIGIQQVITPPEEGDGFPFTFPYPLS